jgi:kinesin family protein 5
MLKTMDSGSQNRKVAFTGMNERSSRSHSLFIIHIHQRNLNKCYGPTTIIGKKY